MTSDKNNRIVRRKSLLWYFMIPVMAYRKAAHYVRLRRGTARQAGMPPDKYRIDPAWEDQPFLKLYSDISTHTIVDRFRCHILYQLANATLKMDGNIAELGVYKGGTAKLLCSLTAGSDKKVYLFDTFEGMPETDSRDLHKKGDFGDTSYESVAKYLSDFPHAFLRKGFFPDTTVGLEICRFALVHVDADIFQSVYDACCFFYPRLERGGFMVFDDYGQRSCPGAKQAVDTYFRNSGETPVWLTSGQCLVIRTQPCEYPVKSNARQ